MRGYWLGCAFALAAACGVARDSLGKLPAAGTGAVEVPRAGGAGSADVPGDSGTGGSAAGGGGIESAAGGGGGAAGDVCAADGCDATSQPLRAYCDHDQAHCPADIEAARTRACSPLLQEHNDFMPAPLMQRTKLPNNCGGMTVRMRYIYGTIEYYFGADSQLRAVTTLTANAGGPCNASFYRYGDSTCAPAGDGEDIRCQ